MEFVDRFMSSSNTSKSSLASLFCPCCRPARYPPVRYGDYLLERLDKNYAYRQQPA